MTRTPTEIEPVKTRTPAELKAATAEVYSRMTHQPAPRGFMDRPRIDTCSCTSPNCSCKGGHR